MAKVGIRMYEHKQGEPRRVSTLFVDGERVPVQSMDLDVNVDDRVYLGTKEPVGRTYRLNVDGDVLFETSEQPTRVSLDDGATEWRWDNVRLLFEIDPQICIYKEIAKSLFDWYPDARWGPGHVVLEDGNWIEYDDAIGLTLFVLASRSMRALGCDDFVDEFRWLRHVRGKWCVLADRTNYFANHSIAELGATLAALELIRWHEEGHQGDAPKK